MSPAALDGLAEELARRLRLTLPSPLPTESPHQVSPVSRKGIEKHGNAWRIRTTIGGHWVVSTGFASAAEAAEHLYRLRTNPRELEAYLTAKLAGNDGSVADHLRYYLRHRGGQVKSADRYRQLAKHLTRHLGVLPADGIRQAQVDEYLTTRVREGATKKTAYNELCLLRTSLRYGWLNDRLAQQPRFVLRVPRSPRKRVAWPEEAQALVTRAELPLLRVLLAGYCLGMRRGEIIGAEWDWVNPHTHELVLPETKNGEVKVVPIPDGLWELLQQPPRHPRWLFARWRKGLNGRSPTRVDIVPWAKTSLRRAWADLLELAGVQGLRVHDLRRSMATVAQDRGHASRAVQQLGGWLDAGVMARHYTHPRRSAVAAIAADLEGVVNFGQHLEAVK